MKYIDRYKKFSEGEKKRSIRKTHQQHEIEEIKIHFDFGTMAKHIIRDSPSLQSLFLNELHKTMDAADHVRTSDLSDDDERLAGEVAMQLCTEAMKVIKGLSD